LSLSRTLLKRRVYIILNKFQKKSRLTFWKIKTNTIFSAVGCLGASIAQILIQKVSGIDYFIPIGTIVISHLVFLLPATLNKKLPETFKESAEIKHEMIFCSSGK
jgi:hypothetical protein